MVTAPTRSEFVASRAVGNATITAISDGSGRSTILKSLSAPPEEWRREVAVDEHDEVVLGYTVAHVRLGEASILIDLGFDDPAPESQWRAPRHQRTPGVVAGLAAIGVQPADITHVLITHAHGDHIAGGSVLRDGRRAPRYPNARHFLGRADWEGNPERAQPDSLLARHLGPVAEAGLLELVDAERAVAPGIAILPAPGESAGHCIVRVNSAGETFYFLGDLFHHPCEVAHLDWVSAGRDAGVMRASREALIAAALPANALLLTTHLPFPGFGRLRAADGGIRWVEA